MVRTIASAKRSRPHSTTNVEKRFVDLQLHQDEPTIALDPVDTGIEQRPGHMRQHTRAPARRSRAAVPAVRRGRRAPPGRGSRPTPASSTRRGCTSPSKNTIDHSPDVTTSSANGCTSTDRCVTSSSHRLWSAAAVASDVRQVPYALADTAGLTTARVQLRRSSSARSDCLWPRSTYSIGTIATPASSKPVRYRLSMFASTAAAGFHKFTCSVSHRRSQAAYRASSR